MIFFLKKSRLCFLAIINCWGTYWQKGSFLLHLPLSPSIIFTTSLFFFFFSYLYIFIVIFFHSLLLDLLYAKCYYFVYFLSRVTIQEVHWKCPCFVLFSFLFVCLVAHFDWAVNNKYLKMLNSFHCVCRFFNQNYVHELNQYTNWQIHLFTFSTNQS